MSYSNNWNKKAALFASGLITALAFRLPISTAAFCVTRFNIDPSYLGIFSNRIVNAMLMAQLFGNWFGVLFTALDGKVKLIVLAVSSWLGLLSFIFALFFFCHSEKGHLTGYYWSIFVSNFFSMVSEAQCIEIAPPDSTILYVFTFSLSPIYISLIKTFVRILINLTTSKNTLDKLTAISTRSLKTSIDYRVSVLIFVNTTLLTLSICVLWTVVAVVVGDNGRIDKNHITWLKYLNGVIIGAILTVPGALLGLAVGSLFVKCLQFCLKEQTCVKLMESRQIIFGIVGAVVVFVSVIGGTKHVPDESEDWVPSNKCGVNVELAKYAGGASICGMLLGLLFCLIFTRLKRNGYMNAFLSIAGFSLLGAPIGIVPGLVLSSGIELTRNMNLTEMDENQLMKKAFMNDIPTLNALRGWAGQLDPSEPRGTPNKNNNKWARTIQKLVDGNVIVDQMNWNLSNATVEAVSVRAGPGPNDITITVKGVKGTNAGQTFVSGVGGSDNIKDAVQTLVDRELGQGALTIKNVTVTRHGPDQILLTVSIDDKNNKWASVMRGLKSVNVKKKGLPETISLQSATVDVTKVVQARASNQIRVVVGGVKTWLDEADLKTVTERVIKSTLLSVQKLKVVGKPGYTTGRGMTELVYGENVEWDLSSATVVANSAKYAEGPYDITITVKGVKGTNAGQTFVSGVGGSDNIKDAVQMFFNSEFDEGVVIVKKVTGTSKGNGEILITVSLAGQLHQSGLKAIKERIQGVFDDAFGKGGVKATRVETDITAVDGRGTLRGQMTITITAENTWEKAIQTLDTLNVTQAGKHWNLSHAQVDYKSNAVRWEHKGKTIKIRATNVVGAQLGHDLYLGDPGSDNIKNAFQSVLSEIFGTRILNTTRVVGRGTNKDEIELSLELGIDKGKGRLSNVTNGQERELIERPTDEARSLQKAEIMWGWVSSVFMSILGMGTVYSVYPGMAPCSITELRYLNRIDVVIMLVSAITPIIIIYVSEAKLCGPEEKWDGKGKWWYVGLLFTVVQIICMIIVVFVVQRPDNKLAKTVTSSPVSAGALTATIVLCQVTSKCIGYAGVVANSGFTMMTFNNTATLTLTVLTALLGEGYLTELKKYEPGMWPTEGMGGYNAFIWWCGKAFVNTWKTLTSICTRDMRRDMALFATNNQPSQATSFIR